MIRLINVTKNLAIKLIAAATAILNSEIVMSRFFKTTFFLASSLVPGKLFNKGEIGMPFAYPVIFILKYKWRIYRQIKVWMST